MLLLFNYTVIMFMCFKKYSSVINLIYSGQQWKNNFVQLVLNEADTLNSSSLLIYYQAEQGLYTQKG